MKDLNRNARDFANDLLAKVGTKRHKLCKPGVGDRTKLIKGILHAMANKRKLTFYPYVTDARGSRELLCDFVWLRRPKGRLERAELVAECEWANSIKSILFDFRKLMLIKSDLKLCIYQIKKLMPEGTEHGYLRRFEGVLAKYKDHRRNEHYFLLELNRKEEMPMLYFWRSGSCIANFH